MNLDVILWHVLLALAAVVALGQLLGRLFRLVGQPPVIGEVLAGILLGPSLLGRISPEAQSYILPAEIVPALYVIAQLGVILYLLAIGLELNTESLARMGTAPLVISLAGIAVPFALGVLLALGLHSQEQGGPSLLVFALFLGVALSITAFPVLARILSDRGLTRTSLGQLALVCAAAGDAIAWCLLAIATGVAKAQVGDAVSTLAWTTGYLLVMWLVVRPLVGRWLASPEIAAEPTKNGAVPNHTVPISPAQIGVVMVAVLVSALATEWIGIHALFGAFVLGALIPHDSPLAEQLGKHIENVVVVLMLPAFFAFTGLRTELGLISGWQDWLLCGLIIAVATVGKFGGTLVAARWMGQSWRDSAALGALMNTRGLMELIVLNVGLDLGIISPRLYAMLVIMALVTTVATAPILQWIERGKRTV
ncbi:MAG: cation:proton antiporter [Pirellulaceae bacterium]|nr:cation:proton antiporter [Pirellulaceae bacterium]